jgi:hypothetical protein
VSVELTPVGPEAAARMLAGEPPGDFAVPDDYPTEFSTGIAENAGKGLVGGPFFIRRVPDGLVVGEIGGAVVDPEWLRSATR